MALIGSIETFNRKTDDWLLYIERLEFFFEANGITDESKKRASLIMVIGPETHKTLKSILAPNKPSETSYDEIIKALSTHFHPQRSQVLYRSNFYQCVKKPGDSVATYLSEQRALANDCEFGDTLNVMLRDRLVCGINDPVIHNRLLTEGNALTLEKAVTLAQALESVVKDSQDLSGVHPVHKITPSRPKPRRQAGNGHGTVPANKGTPCYRCGKAGHSQDSCRFKKETCY